MGERRPIEGVGRGQGDRPTSRVLSRLNVLKHTRVLVTLLAVVVLSAFAQQKKKTTPAPAPAEPQQQTVFPLETLKVEGNRRIPAEKIIAVAGLKIGAAVVKADFDAARDRLLATGAFESVGCEFKPSASNTGYAGVIEVVEVEQLYPYRFEDLPLSDEAIRAALRKQESLMGDQIPGTKDVLDRYVQDRSADGRPGR